MCFSHYVLIRCVHFSDILGYPHEVATVATQPTHHVTHAKTTTTAARHTTATTTTTTPIPTTTLPMLNVCKWTHLISKIIFVISKVTKYDERIF